MFLTVDLAATKLKPKMSLLQAKKQTWERPYDIVPIILSLASGRR
jgi:hypothetical protein